MTKIQFSAQGTIPNMIKALALAMLQNDELNDLVMGAAIAVTEISIAEQKAKADVLAEQMKEMINQKQLPHDSD